ncbi:hypothetical protein FQN49_006221 [Arthroderma sp. PD_2]|nr:hypothetical protein FQN49_006221 [Arthroderma sp. PD_2]
MDPVLVIGGCGGLGHTVIKQLLENGHATDITVFDVSTKRNNIDGVKYIQGSISSLDDVQRVLDQIKPRVIFHSASPLPTQRKNTNALYERVNVLGNHNLIKVIREVRTVKVLVYTSSSSVIHDGFSDIVEATEEEPRVYYPQSEFYSHTKAIAEDIILAANRKDGLLSGVIRGAALFGEGDNLTIPQMIVGAKSGRNKFRVGDGKNLYDFTYLGNAAHAHVLLGKALLAASADPQLPPDNERIDGETFVVTNDEHIPFWDFVYAVGEAAGYPIAKKDIWQVPSWLFYAMAVAAEWTVWAISFGRRESGISRMMVRYLSMTRTFDISKIKTRLGYRPQVRIHEAIKRSVDACMRDSSNKD